LQRYIKLNLYNVLTQNRYCIVTNAASATISKRLIPKYNKQLPKIANELTTKSINPLQIGLFVLELEVATKVSITPFTIWVICVRTCTHYTSKFAIPNSVNNSQKLSERKNYHTVTQRNKFYVYVWIISVINTTFHVTNFESMNELLASVKTENFFICKNMYCNIMSFQYQWILLQQLLKGSKQNHFL